MSEYACGKQRVIAVVVPNNGKPAVIGENTRATDRACPRYGMKSGEGYFHCEECGQEDHAEVKAVRAAKASAAGSTVIILGHTYACDSCRSVMEEAGVIEVFFAEGLI